MKTLRQELINFLNQVDSDDLKELMHGMISEERIVDNYLKAHESICYHVNAYHFHNNAPPYCPDCKKYLEQLTPSKK